MIKKNSKIYIAGHNGQLGGSIHKLLIAKKYTNIITIKRSQLNLSNYKKVETFFKKKNLSF